MQQQVASLARALARHTSPLGRRGKHAWVTAFHPHLVILGEHADQVLDLAGKMAQAHACHSKRMGVQRGKAWVACERLAGLQLSCVAPAAAQLPVYLWAQQAYGLGDFRPVRPNQHPMPHTTAIVLQTAGRGPTHP